ncbi:MAG: hypothetical protein CVU71_14245 [Deltaproteobacteria bacterium HGW-Deltaproteobacteria-6]|jgi:hypothetical protein|nr:MAG: hypothetical protein CVU71_14245 [Deltaproteobacteria bacterium HGW-Deltaproteobacteria-6]
MKKQTGSLWIKRSLISLSCLLLFGCGYGFAPQGEHIDQRLKNVYVAPFGNKTAEAEVENFMRTAFINQIIQSKRFKAVSSIDQADAIISGKVLNLSTAALSYQSNILAAEERMTVTLEIDLREKDSGKIIWYSRNVVGTTDYKVQDVNNPRPARKQALTKLSLDTVENAYNLMMSDF